MNKEMKIRIPQDVASKIKKMASDEDRTINAVINRMIKKCMEDKGNAQD